ASKQRALQAVQAAKDEAAIKAATQQAEAAKGSADAAAVTYGMPHLKDCPKAMKGELPPIGTWRTETAMPTPVQQVGTAVLDGRIWVIGGLANGVATAKTLIYDPAIQTWTPGPDLPLPLHHAMAVNYQGELVVIGGFIAQGTQLTAITSNQVYRLRDGLHWESWSPLHHARGAGAAGVIGNRIVVVGGAAGGLLVPSTEIFDGTSWHDGAPVPIPGDHLAAVSDGSALYAVGGRNLTANLNSAALHRYDLAGDRWTRLADMPTARGGLGAAMVDGRIIAVGGEGPTTVFGTVESYDTVTGIWSALANVHAPRHGMAVAAVNSQLYAIAGAGRPGHTDSVATVEELDVSDQVAAAASTPVPASTVAGAAATWTIYQCPSDAGTAKWACLTSAVLRNGGLAIDYTTNFTPSDAAGQGHFHLHFFAANPKGDTDTVPSAAVEQMSSANPGSWFTVYDQNVKNIDASTERAGGKAPLDMEHFSLLCVRVAMGAHDLARDNNGGYDTGNCVRISM
ncbi:MAG TPA: kelch repeat-containing protein, partial [Kineosporiaceae bacterium]|nr:kelch repeat-containing protein [Kineosporiaceae bacterium]